MAEAEVGRGGEVRIAGQAGVERWGRGPGHRAAAQARGTPPRPGPLHSAYLRGCAARCARCPGRGRGVSREGGAVVPFS